ncbi:MAG TPA: hypothetical protein VLZ75_02720 [Chitinophagales bacterium]|nr:hypothetical protein [Chitinophagales bacterium]
MRYLVWILSILFMTSANSQSDRVYICTGPQSIKYHYSSKCRGLNSCSKDVIAVSLTEARSKGRTFCRLE